MPHLRSRQRGLFALQRLILSVLSTNKSSVINFGHAAFICFYKSLLYQIVLLEDFMDSFERAFNLLFGVRCHQRVADEGILRCYCRSNNGIYEYAFVEQIARYVEGLVIVANEEGDNRR